MKKILHFSIITTILSIAFWPSGEAGQEIPKKRIHVYITKDADGNLVAERVTKMPEGTLRIGTWDVMVNDETGYISTTPTLPYEADLGNGKTLSTTGKAEWAED